MDIGLIVGYLVSYLAGKAKQIGDSALDALLQQLYQKVAGALLQDSSLRKLKAEPSNESAQAELSEKLAVLVSSNQQLARDLEAVVSELNERGAQQSLVSAPIHGQAFQQVSANQGSIVGNIGGNVNIINSPPFPSLDIASRARLSRMFRAPGPVGKAYMILCGLLVGGGFLTAATTLVFSDARPDVGFPGTLKVGFFMFFLGVVLSTVGMVIAGLSGAKRMVGSLRDERASGQQERTGQTGRS